MATATADKTPLIGVAGWSIPAAYRSHFGEGDSVLARYATRLDCVEINSAFYRPHQRKTYARWANSVPARFRFSVKMPKAITHEHALQRCGGLLDRFFDECSGLGDKLGAVLVQLPPSLAFDARTASVFFAMARRRSPQTAALVCEPRHRSWLSPEAEALLARHRINRVGADPDPIGAGGEPSASGACRYWRLHGSPRVYYSPYDEDRLGILADRLDASPRAWVIFDNTAAGYAVRDALRLKQRMHGWSDAAPD